MSPRHLSRRLCRLSNFGALAIACLLVLPAFGLEIPAQLRKQLLSQMEGTGKSAPPASAMEGFDNSLDTLAYRVGGGDQFLAIIEDLPSQPYYLTVQSDGNIYDAEIGLIRLGPIPLAEAVDKIRESVQTSLKRGSKAYVVLKQPKTVTFTVAGAISTPGTFQLSGVMRVLDGMKMAHRALLPEPDSYDLRSVRITNGSESRTIDILAFLSTGNPDENPYLYPGDIITVKPLGKTIYLGGAVHAPYSGSLPLRPGESLDDFLKGASFWGTADTTSVTVRSVGSRLSVLTRDEWPGFKLSFGDVIVIANHGSSSAADTVKVSGLARHPGTYSIQSGVTKFSEILAQAGGITEEGNPDKIVVLRHAKQIRDELSPQMDPASMNGKTNLPILTGHYQSVRPEMASGMNQMTNLNGHLILYPRETGGDLILIGGDEIFIPETESVVYLSGEVKRPGAYPFKSGADVRYYLELAGGYTGNADSKNTVLASSHKGYLSVRSSGLPLDGDIIVVPTSIEYKRLTTVAVPVLQIVATIISSFAGVITSIYLISQI